MRTAVALYESIFQQQQFDVTLQCCRINKLISCKILKYMKVKIPEEQNVQMHKKCGTIVYAKYWRSLIEITPVFGMRIMC